LLEIHNFDQEKKLVKEMFQKSDGKGIIYE
jgi:hypothetical protein